VDRGFVQFLQLFYEFLTFFKKVRVSPSGGINHFWKCGLMARVAALHGMQEAGVWGKAE